MKGFQRIPIGPNAADRQQSKAKQGSHFESLDENISGTLFAKAKLIRPIHVGTGDLVIPSQLISPPDNSTNIPLIAPFFREANLVCIPGSSIKGAFRHLYETVTASCLAQANTNPKKGGAPVDSHLKSCSYRADTRGDQHSLRLCPACRVFGALGYLGQVFFHTAYPAADTSTQIKFAPQRWSPRIISENSRKLYTHQAALKEDGQPYEPREPLEILPEGSELTLQMDFTSLAPAELGLLLLLMGQKQGEKIYPKLGGVKAHGWGAINIYDVIFYLRDKQSYLTYDSVTKTSREMEPYFVHLEKTLLMDTAAWADVLAYLSNVSEI